MLLCAACGGNDAQTDGEDARLGREEVVQQEEVETPDASETPEKSETPEASGETQAPGEAEPETQTPQTAEPETVELTLAGFDQLLQEQPLAVTKSELLIQSEDYKALYPDMLQAILQNNTQADIRDAVVAFVAWDENGLPVKIQGQFDFSGGSYIKRVSYDDINLVGGAAFGESSGFSLDEHHTILTCRAIAVSYETFDGESWENPYYDAFCALYEGQRQS